MKKVISVLMATLLFSLSFTANAFAQSSVDNNLKVDELLEKRAEFICLEQWDNVASIDQQLEQLGVEKLTAQEVEEHFVSVTPYVSTPVSSNVTWFSSRRDYTYGGVIYEVQTLTAQPNQNNSQLKTSGSRAIASSYKWKAGAMNALSVVGSALVGEIPGASLYLTVFETVSGFVSGISKTTEISSAEIVYSYAHTTTASFKYVKVKGQSDDYQSLTYISTMGTTAVGYQYPTFRYSGGSVQPNIIQGQRTINSIPTGYNSNANAVKAYLDPYAPTRAFVGRIKITGLESKSISTISPACPQFPSQVY
ncbi:hypothetical protein [Pseudoflavonifractor sp. An85]|uniref:hypothetical protein n=1 Tax=Pseudoflavonifractor sp. An85 TaxID=1965661 RepID=UPI00117B9D0B|nr:hypothetical protein [Pseudoflavonifractor sp. An85]